MVLHLKTNVRLAPLTTFGVGGRAAFFVQVKNPDELVAAVKLATEKHLPYFLLAGGSNVVFGDRTFRGSVIHFVPKVKPCQCQGLTLTCSANLTLAVLIKTAINHNLVGLEMLSGIPGTVGGAVVGNAGAYGQSISDCLVRVEIFNPDKNKRQWLTKKQCRFAYRGSVFKSKNWLLLRTQFKLSRGDKNTLAKKSREIIKLREKKYHSNLRCPGSFFKNVLVKEVSKKTLKSIPPEKIIDGKIPAGYLLEQVGAKGMRVGGIVVAAYHGNLLINNGRGTYREVVTLATKLKKLVQKKFGIGLAEEVRYVAS